MWGLSVLDNVNHESVCLVGLRLMVVVLIIDPLGSELPWLINESDAIEFFRSVHRVITSGADKDVEKQADQEDTDGDLAVIRAIELQMIRCPLVLRTCAEFDIEVIFKPFGDRFQDMEY